LHQVGTPLYLYYNVHIGAHSCFEDRKVQNVVGSFKNCSFVVAAVVIVVFMSRGPPRYVINSCTGNLPTAKSAIRKHWGMCLHRFADPQLGLRNVINLSAQVVSFDDSSYRYWRLTLLLTK